MGLRVHGFAADLSTSGFSLAAQRVKVRYETMVMRSLRVEPIFCPSLMRRAQQDRNMWDYLTDFHRAGLAGHRAPSMLPTQAAGQHVA